MRASDAGALNGGREKGVTIEPGSVTISADLTDHIVFVLVIDTDAPGSVGIVAHDCKVRVTCGINLSGKFAVVPSAFAPTVAALKGRYWLVMSTDVECGRGEIPQRFYHPLR